MITAVDTSVLFDVIKGVSSAHAVIDAIEAANSFGSVCVCAPVVAELGRHFGKSNSLIGFLADAQLDYGDISREAAIEAGMIMFQYSKNKGTRSRVPADFLIGAHALIDCNALITRDAGFYRDYFKGLKIINPAS